jgi:hypothetical protein
MAAKKIISEKWKKIGGSSMAKNQARQWRQAAKAAWRNRAAASA